MTEDEFWEIIERSHADDQDIQMFRLEENGLNTLDYDELVRFEHHFQTLLDKSYTWDLWAVAYIINGGCSDDEFEYFRDWLISKGRDVYYAALSDPETLVGVATPYHTEFESFRYIVSEVAEERFGKPLPMDLWIRPHTPSGVPWDEDSLGQKFPELTAWINSFENLDYAGRTGHPHSLAAQQNKRNPLLIGLSILSLVIGIWGFYQSQSQQHTRNQIQATLTSHDFFISVCETMVTWQGQEHVDAKEYFTRKTVTYKTVKAQRPVKIISNELDEDLWQIEIWTETDRFLCSDKISHYDGNLTRESTMTLTTLP